MICGLNQAVLSLARTRWTIAKCLRALQLHQGTTIQGQDQAVKRAAGESK